MRKILFLFGTRPEAIKMAPLIEVFKQDDNFDVKVGITAQHREMLDQVNAFFNIHPDYDLDIMTPNQSLHQLTADLISRITNEILLLEKFDLVFVQGDTTTVLASALAAFYQKLPIVHIEAGLRSGDMQSPFPEEMNRVLTSRIATYHFCPTQAALENLKTENITNNVFVVGNTVIDALLTGINNISGSYDNTLREKYRQIDFTKKIILVTCHRRENFGKPFIQICDALLELASTYVDDIQIVYPVHLNPNIKDIAFEKLAAKNIALIAPLDYPELIWMMNKSHIILTDSGGIQEEAPSLGKPVLVLREVTERMEGIFAGTSILVGANKSKIIEYTSRLLSDESFYATFSSAVNPYGNGTAAMQIKRIIEQQLPVLS